MGNFKNRLRLVASIGLSTLPVLVNAAAPPPDEEKETKPVIIFDSPLLEPLLPRERFLEMDLLRWPEDGFYGSFNTLMNDLTTAHGVEKPAAMMDFAELYLSQMLLFEAGSVLTSSAPETQAQARRHLSLMHALSLLRGIPVEDFTDSPLVEPNRPDRAFWLTLEAITAGNAADLSQHLPAGFGAMIHQPRPVLRAVLPVFVEASVAIGNKELADIAVQLIDELPELADAPVGHFLRGRVAELVGNEKTALDSYFLAAKGWDKYAARGRLALADMALVNGAEGALLAARDVLTYGADAWRGDNYELQVLSRLAAVFHDLGDVQGELVTSGKIILRFPQNPLAREANATVETLLSKLYDQGVDGTLPLARWTSIHLGLMPIFKDYPGFPTQVERLADKAFDLGGFNLAITEYTRALLLHHEIAVLYGRDADPKMTNRLKYKLAHAHFRAGQIDEAWAVVADIDTADQPALFQKVAALSLGILDARGDTDQLLKTSVTNPNARQIRSIASALFEIEDWADAVTAFHQLWNEHPNQFGVDDATYLLIAAHRIDDMETAQKVVDAFPRLTQSANWIGLAEDLLAAPAPILPLNQEGADARLGSLDKTLDTIEASGL